MQQKAEQSKLSFIQWIKSPNSTTVACNAATREIIKHGKSFKDGEYMKELFIKISEHLFADFKNKREIVQTI